ncbi:hypothetical protein G5V59_02460 [Nocardioides sp. W3-2-3]|uniref:hypothetical protein n=1 Tax=Nocardioides convexus TaxID=2712224 RepID=UPI0024186E2D|nr:hypothetical protein [Nocardioides convexus]NGZ99615.1 hypothetical protein [Nocardioides convexus]
MFVRVSARDGQALAQGEALLAQEYMADEPAPLKWLPPTLGAWPLAFDVVHVVLDRDWKVDLGDKLGTTASGSTTRSSTSSSFTTLPFTRDWDTTIIPALEVPEDPDDPVVISIDTCDSTAGWTRLSYPATGWAGLTGPTTNSGSVRISASVPSSGSSWPWTSILSLERSGTVTMDGTPYLRLLVYVADGGVTPFKPDVTVQYNGGGQAVEPVSVQQAQHGRAWLHDVVPRPGVVLQDAGQRPLHHDHPRVQVPLRLRRVPHRQRRHRRHQRPPGRPHRNRGRHRADAGSDPPQGQRHRPPRRVDRPVLHRRLPRHLAARALLEHLLAGRRGRRPDEDVRRDEQPLRRDEVLDPRPDAHPREARVPREACRSPGPRC